MPIIRLAKAGGFAPEEITVFTKAFEDACRIVGLTDPTTGGATSLPKQSLKRHKLESAIMSAFVTVACEPSARPARLFTRIAFYTHIRIIHDFEMGVAIADKGRGVPKACR